MIMMGGSDDTVYLGRWLRGVFRLTWNDLYGITMVQSEWI